MTAEESFWAKVRKTDTCWLWTGARSKGGTGYGQFMVGGRHLIAHRFSFELHTGPIPPGMLVCHTCDTPPCCNPAHLFLGSNRDNLLDASRKGRLPAQRDRARVRGERNGFSVLSDEQVAWIRRVARSGTAKATEVARQLGVSATTARQAASGVRWSHVAEPPCPFPPGRGHRAAKVSP